MTTFTPTPLATDGRAVPRETATQGRAALPHPELAEARAYRRRIDADNRLGRAFLVHTRSMMRLGRAIEGPSARYQLRSRRCDRTQRLYYDAQRRLVEAVTEHVRADERRRRGGGL